GAGERLGDSLGDAGRVALVLYVLDQDGELVASEARDGVPGPQRLLQSWRDRREQLVPGRVPEAVVDELELVEIEEEDRHRGVPALRLGEGVGEAVEEQRPVRQPGERVVQGLMAGA